MALRRLLEVVSKMEVDVIVVNATASEVPVVTNLFQNWTESSNNATNADDFVWCGAFCGQNAAAINVAQSGELIKLATCVARGSKVNGVLDVSGSAPVTQYPTIVRIYNTCVRL